MAAIAREPDLARTLARPHALAPIEGELTLGALPWRPGRAYRAGRLVCGCVQVAVRFDDRLGLTRRERRIVQVRFSEPVDDELRTELRELAGRRGRASQRAAERIDPVELVIYDPSGEQEHMTGRLQPPYSRHGQLGEIEFGFGQLTRS
jgi:hypothetical protein